MPGGQSRTDACEAKRRGYGALGRDDIALEFTESLNSGIGAPARLMRIAGQRGSGNCFAPRSQGSCVSSRGFKQKEHRKRTRFLSG